MNPDKLFDAADHARLLDEIPDSILILDSEFNLVWANQLAEQVFQTDVEEFIGTPSSVASTPMISIWHFAV